MHTYLVLAPCLQPHLCQGEAIARAQAVIVRDGQFATVIHRRGHGDELAVREVASHGAPFLLHLSDQHGTVSSVEDPPLPVVLHNLGSLNTLGIDHQSAGVLVEAVNAVCVALEVAALEILVEHRLDAELLGRNRHGEYSCGLLYDDDVLVLIHHPYPLVDELGVAAVPGDAYHIARNQLEVMARDELVIYRHPMASQDVLDLVAADSRHLFVDEFRQRTGLFHHVLPVF